MRPGMRATCLAIILVAGGGTVARAQLPIPDGCITDVHAFDREYTCEGLKVAARIPAQCQAPGCGLILLLHGDNGSGTLMDRHVKLRDLGTDTAELHKL